MRDQHDLLLVLRMDEEADQQPSGPRGRRSRTIGVLGALSLPITGLTFPQHH